MNSMHSRKSRQVNSTSHVIAHGLALVIFAVVSLSGCESTIASPEAPSRQVANGRDFHFTKVSGRRGASMKDRFELNADHVAYDPERNAIVFLESDGLDGVTRNVTALSVFLVDEGRIVRLPPPCPTSPDERVSHPGEVFIGEESTYWVWCGGRGIVDAPPNMIGGRWARYTIDGNGWRHSYLNIFQDGDSYSSRAVLRNDILLSDNIYWKNGFGSGAEGFSIVYVELSTNKTFRIARELEVNCYDVGVDGRGVDGCLMSIFGPDAISSDRTEFIANIFPVVREGQQTQANYGTKLHVLTVSGEGQLDVTGTLEYIETPTGRPVMVGGGWVWSNGGHRCVASLEGMACVENTHNVIKSFQDGRTFIFVPPEENSINPVFIRVTANGRFAFLMAREGRQRARIRELRILDLDQYKDGAIIPHDAAVRVAGLPDARGHRLIITKNDDVFIVLRKSIRYLGTVVKDS